MEFLDLPPIDTEDVVFLKRFNGFYKEPKCREIIHALYRGKCWVTNQIVPLQCGHVGHIIPQSDPEFFERFFPGLDVHNIINLHWVAADKNQSIGNNILHNPALLHYLYAKNKQIIETRLPKLIEQGVKARFSPQDIILQLSGSTFENTLIVGCIERLFEIKIMKSKGEFQNWDKTHWLITNPQCDLEDWGFVHDACFGFNDDERLVGKNLLQLFPPSFAYFSNGVFSHSSGNAALSDEHFDKIARDRVSGFFVPKRELTRYVSSLERGITKAIKASRK